MFLANIKDFFTRNKKIFFYIWIFLVFYYLCTEFSFAAETATTDPKTDTDAWKMLITTLNWLFKIISWLLWLLTQMVWVFLNPSWVNGWVIWIQTHLKELWILVSNVVYFIFAFLIIVIAFMNILWKWDKWELKQALPKFIIWVLIVPLSWFFVQFIISLTSILSASVLSLPMDIFIKNDTKWILDKSNICVDYVIWKDSSHCDLSSTYNWAVKWKKSLAKILQGDTAFWLLNVYTYWIFEIDETVLLYKNVSSGITSIFDLWLQLIFKVILIIVYLVLVIALALALFTRVVRLWVYMIFSPVFWLLYFFWKEKEWFWKFSITEFLWLAMIPVYVTAALSFGLLFIFVAWNWPVNSVSSDKIIKFSTWTTDAYSWIDAAYVEDAETTKINKSSVELLETFKFTMYWDYITGGDLDPSKLTKVLGNFTWSLWTLLVQLFWIAVLWLSVMTALKWSKITEEVVKPIAEFWNSVWQLIAKSPQYAPVFPGWLSMKGMEKVWTMPINALEQKASNRVSWIQTWVNKFFWADSVDVNKIARINGMLNQWWVDSPEELKTLQKELKELIDKHWTGNSQVRELMSKFMTWAAGKWNLGLNVENAKMENLFKDNKLSKEWYWLLHVENLNQNATAFNTSLVDAYAASHQNGWTTSADDTSSTGWWTKWTWDNSYRKITTEEYNWSKASENNVLKIKIEKEAGTPYGEWKIFTLNENWNWWKEFSVTFEDTKIDAQSMTWEDLTELKELFWKLWWKSEKLIAALDGLWFKNSTWIVSDLEKVIKNNKN